MKYWQFYSVHLNKAKLWGIFWGTVVIGFLGIVNYNINDVLNRLQNKPKNLLPQS